MTKIEQYEKYMMLLAEAEKFRRQYKLEDAGLNDVIYDTNTARLRLQQIDSWMN